MEGRGPAALAMTAEVGLGPQSQDARFCAGMTRVVSA